MDTLDDDAIMLVLSQVTVLSQWQPVYTNAAAALQDRDIHRVHRRPQRQTRAAPSCCHPRPDLTLVCRRFLSVLRSDAAERLALLPKALHVARSLLGAMSEAEASLVWEALRDPEGVRVYRDLSQAADELAAMAGAME